jgi:ferredoxin
MACSYGRTKAYSHSASAIRVARAEKLGLDLPVTCIRCYRCVAACPAEALSITDSGAIRLDREKCHPRTWARIQGVKLTKNVTCGACEEACPLGVLDVEDYPFFCTNCGRCIEACEMGALRFGEKPAAEELPSMKEVENLSPAERSLLWALRRAKKLSWVSEEDARIYRQGSQS